VYAIVIPYGAENKLFYFIFYLFYVFCKKVSYWVFFIDLYSESTPVYFIYLFANPIHPLINKNLGYSIHIEMNNHAIYFYLMTDDTCILFYRVWYCISYRTENKLFYFIFLFYLFWSPIPVGRRGVISWFKLFLPAFAKRRGRGGSAPCGYILSYRKACRPGSMNWRTINFFVKLSVHGNRIVRYGCVCGSSLLLLIVVCTCKYNCERPSDWIPDTIPYVSISPIFFVGFAYMIYLTVQVLVTCLTGRGVRWSSVINLALACVREPPGLAVWAEALFACWAVRERQSANLRDPAF